MKTNKSILTAAVIISLSSVLFMSPIHAQTGTNTWDGGSTVNNNWSQGFNWSGDAAPATNANRVLAFGGSTRLTPVNDFAFTDGTPPSPRFHSIVFNDGAGAFTLTGNTMVTGAARFIVNNSTNTQTIGLGVINNLSSDSQLSGIGKIVIGSGGFVSFRTNRFNIGSVAGAVSSGDVELENGGSITSTYIGTSYSYIGQAVTAGANNSGTLTVKSGGVLDSSSAISLGASQTVTNTGVSGTLNVSGGIVDVKDSKGILFGGPFAAANSVDGGSINLSSGTLRVAQIAKQQSTTIANFNFSGGTLAAFGSDNLVVGSTTNARNIAMTLTGSEGVVSSSDKSGIGRTVNIYSAIGEDVAGRGLTFSGNGTTTLHANNTYSGATTITAGSLILGTNGSIGSSSVLDVASGATLNVSAVSGGFAIGSSQILKGSGTIVGNTTINGALQPGNSPGLLTFSNALTLGATAVTTMEIDGAGIRGTDFDAVDVTNLLTYDGALNLTIGTTFTVGNYSFDLFNFGSQSGSFDTVELGGSYAGSLTNNGFGIWGRTSGNDTWTFNQSDGVLGLTVVPEPSTSLLLLGAGIFLAALRRRLKR